MNKVQERANRAAESLLENESLTADLDDESAQALLDWALACAERIAQSTADLDDGEAEEAMSPRLRAVRRMMRLVNAWLASPAERDIDGGEPVLDQIIDQVQAVYGPAFIPPSDDQRQALLGRRTELAAEPQRLIADLRGLLEAPPDAPQDEETQHDQEI